MKFIFKAFIIILLVGIVSCRDTKKAENGIESVEDINTQTTPDNETLVEDTSEEVKAASEDLDKEVEELEDALKELDDI